MGLRGLLLGEFTFTFTTVRTATLVYADVPRADPRQYKGLRGEYKSTVQYL